MSGTRGGVGRIVAMGVALALALLIAGEARAQKYSVAQCGWFVGADADWADNTGGLKFRPDAFCVPPPGSDPFEGVHLKSLTREGQAAVAGAHFGRWRWSAPPGTGITKVRASWWHALHDGFEQRVGVVGPGGFEPFRAAAGTDTTPTEFVAGFATPMAALEDRLLCAKAETRSCSLEAPSWSGLRALTITLEDAQAPGAAVGGELLGGGWQRGGRGVSISASDAGSGVRFAETTLDGARVGLTELPCAKVSIGGEWRATKMRPCATGAQATHSVATASFSDGPHALGACVVDFAGNTGCAPARTVQIDNNPPAHPRAVALAGGERWRRTNDFDLTWTDPDQGPASPVAGAGWRLTGPGGYDSGAQFAPGRDRAALADLTVPVAGEYTLKLWLRDEAGNEAPAAAVELPLRFDDVAPGVAFGVADLDGGAPEEVSAEVRDADSGPASGALLLKRAGAPAWTELPTKLSPASARGEATLTAPLPELGPGTYLFRAEASDAAGNTASTTRRADGTEMSVRRGAAAAALLFARLRGARGRGDSLTVPFGTAALLGGRLTRADGAGLAGRLVRVVARPLRGALVPTETRTVRTGERGGFELRLGPGPSRRVSVSFAGEEALAAAERAPLELRVRAGVSLRAAPLVLSTGQVLRLSGRVRSRGAPIPRRGKLVAIQYLEGSTHRWRPVLIVRTDRSGRFRAHYRFRYITSPAAIRLRATALAEERWPYAPGSSRTVTVHVGDR
jgi:hypothetical protein